MTTPTEPQKATTKDITDLRKHDGPLYVRNMSYKQQNIRHGFGPDRVNLELTPAGTADSVAMLPKLALELRGFQRAWKRGELMVSTDPAMENVIDLLMNQHIAGTAAQQAGFDQTLAKSNTAVELKESPCLVCGRRNREGVIEGGRVIQSFLDTKNGVPPLCDEHVDQGHRFTPVLKQGAKGEDIWEFTAIAVG